MKKYYFPKLNDVLNVKVGTKRVWEERVQNQNLLIYLLENAFGTDVNLKAFAFYPQKLYFGMPLTFYPDYVRESRSFWEKIIKLFEKNRWNVYAAFEHIDPSAKLPQKFTSFKQLDFDHTEVLLSELVLMDLNHPSFGVGQEIQISLFQPLIGFSKGRVPRMVIGRPGSLILKYEKEEELLEILGQIAKRKSYRQEPFYVRKCSKHPFKTIYKGKICLNCQFRDNLQT